MITADEARTKTKDALKEKAGGVLETIYKEIDKECAKGNYELLFYGTVEKEIITALKEKGYRVKYYPKEFDDYCNYYDSCLEINWKKKGVCKKHGR